MCARFHGAVVLTFLIMAIMRASSAGAQAPSQGRVTADGSVIWRSDAALPAGTVGVGAVLTIVAQSQRWYEVLVPGRLGERGVIARTQVQLLPGSPEPPARPLRGDPAPAGAQGGVPRRVAGPVRARFDRGFLAVSGTYRFTASDFGDTLALRTFAENGRYDTEYSVPTTGGLAVAAGVMVSPSVGVGAAVSRVAQEAPAALSGEVPHPFFFNAPRRITGQLSDLRRDELAFHAQVRGLLPFGRHVEVALFGGPSVFQVKQGIVRDVSVSSSYPHDEARFESASVVVGKASTIGFNAGGDVALFPGRHAGFGFNLMYSRGTADVPAEGNRAVSIRTGGVSASAGLRLRF